MWQDKNKDRHIDIMTTYALRAVARKLVCEQFKPKIWAKAFFRTFWLSWNGWPVFKSTPFFSSKEFCAFSGLKIFLALLTIFSEFDGVSKKPLLTPSLIDMSLPFVILCKHFCALFTIKTLLLGHFSSETSSTRLTSPLWKVDMRSFGVDSFKP